MKNEITGRICHIYYRLFESFNRTSITSKFHVVAYRVFANQTHMRS